MSAHTPSPWTAMRKPPASYSDHGWRTMAMCGDKWMVAAPVGVARQVKDGVVVKSWNNEANCHRIVQCVNAHDKMLAALEAAYTKFGDFRLDWPGRDTLEGQALLFALRDAIASATDRDGQDVQDDYCSRAAIAKAGGATCA